MTSRRLLISTGLLFWFALILLAMPRIARGAEDEICLGCHADKSLTFSFADGKKASAYVDDKALKASVHKALSCTSCHGNFSPENHPKTKLKDKRQFTLMATEACRDCHTASQLKKRSIHSSILNGKGKIVCVDCHGSHSIRKIAGGKSFTDEAQYCMNCHSHELTLSFRNGDKLHFKVDAHELGGSVHSKLGCSDCHFGFSMEQHLVRNFKSRRDYSIASIETCRRCHFDKYIKTLDSIHYTVLSQGNLAAPVCTDCHGAHNISGALIEKVGIARRCQKCHESIYEVYAQSVHGSALLNGTSKDVPVCVDCHNSHNIMDPRTFDYRERVPEMCGGCHASKDIMKKYGLSTEVVNTYLQDFHGITLKFYKRERKLGEADLEHGIKPIAVCTDCHGIHDIMKTSAPNASIVKANLVKRCRKCHVGATENFPNSWISHYKPTLSNAPLVFLINLLYKVFIPFMIIGLVLQILLHIWRYAVNR
jgi:hypothetical protein